MQKPPPLVLVEWLDSRSPAPGWCLVSDRGFPSICRCITVGYLVKDGKRRKVLAQSIADLNHGPLQANGLMAIPAGCIVAMKPLRT